MLRRMTPDQHVAAVTAACRKIESAEEVPSLAELAAGAGMSAFHFHRVFKKLTGVTPLEYASARRSGKVRAQLLASATVTEAIYEAGFNSNGRFYATSGRMLGMAPKTFRSGGTGERIRFAIGQCSLGAILVASSAKGVCCITLGDDPEFLLADLQNRFRQAELVGGDRDYEETVATVVGFVEAPRLGLQLPLDIRGTAFQQRVWQALREIPPGHTVSYAQIAARIGSPNSVRAVAGACAANSIAVAIPCHRVVRTGGGISGYRWGVERKRTLLDREGPAN